MDDFVPYVLVRINFFAALIENVGRKVVAAYRGKGEIRLQVEVVATRDGLFAPGVDERGKVAFVWTLVGGEPCVTIEAIDSVLRAQVGDGWVKERQFVDK